jgi:hypothetical protein
MTPMTVKAIRNHQPVRPMSCRRRTEAEMLGSSSPSDRAVPSGLNPLSENSVMSIAIATMETIKKKSAQYQYSDRGARPEKVA